jgi:hypothetical protein
MVSSEWVTESARILSGLRNKHLFLAAAIDFDRKFIAAFHYLTAA